MKINDLDDFQIPANNRKLGEGTFSEVFKVKSKQNKKYYALKAVVLLD